MAGLASSEVVSRCLVALLVCFAASGGTGCSKEDVTSASGATATAAPMPRADPKGSSTSVATAAAQAASSTSASAGLAPATLSISADGLAKDAASMEFAALAAKYAGGRRLVVTGKLVAERGGDLALEAKPTRIYLAFRADEAGGAKALVGKPAAVECEYGGKLNDAVNLRDCLVKK